MSKIRVIYLYLVCLITLFMATIGFISCITYLVDSFYPTAYYSSYTNNDYDRVEQKNEKVRNLKSSINSLAFVVVATPIYIYHWKKIEKESKEMEV